MRIFSAYSDYYDSVQAFDPDPTCVYERKREEIEIHNSKSDLIPQHNPFNKWGYRYHHFSKVSERILGFCGKLYPLLLVDNSFSEPFQVGVKSVKWLPKNPTGPLYFYNVESLRKEMERNGIFGKKIKKYDLKWANDGITTHAHFLKEWSDFESKMFVTLKVPIFLTRAIIVNAHRPMDTVEVILNPGLSRLEFYKVKNPFEAYQEIEQFLSGILGMNDPEIVQIADKDMIVKKGFNEMSFRKPPGKKKPRKQKIAKS